MMKFGGLLSILLAACAVQADAAIRNLKELESAIGDNAPRSDPFEVEGVVTCKASALSDQFILTDGDIHIRMTDGVAWPAKTPCAGDRIHALGRIVRQHNDCYNYAKAFRIETLSHEDPPPPVEITPADLNDRLLVNRVVRIEGTVIDVLRDEIDPRFVFLVISSGGEVAYANAYYTNGLEGVSALIGATASVVGICAMAHESNTKRFNLGLQISTSIQGDITILKPAPDDAFDVPLLEGGVRDVRKAIESDTPRRKVCGNVVATWHENNALIRTDAGRVSKIRITNGKAPPHVGDTIEAVGMPETDIYTLNLSRAVWKKTGEAATSVDETPTDISVKSLFADESGRMEMKPGYHGHLVRLRGIVQNVSSQNGRDIRLSLNDNGFDMPVELGFGGIEMAESFKGCTVEATGVCVMETEMWRPQTPFPRILGFFVVPRSPSDVKVLKRPPWWTTGRLFAVIAVLLVLLLVVLAWNMLLQKVSDRKGRELAAARFAKSVSELKVNERTRLATELHDSIVQNLTGASMKLRAVDKMFTSNREESQRQLSLALKTLDSCRDELRNCIWDLRNQALDEPVMDKVLQRVLAPHVGSASLAVRFAVPREKLADNTAHAIICIVRELVLNAVRHGHASAIQVAGCIHGDQLLFSVKDDGCGFDPPSRPGPGEGHFGLQGIQERVEAIGGTITIESAPGKGTKVVATLNISAKRQQPV